MLQSNTLENEWMKNKRIVFKVGTSSLTNQDGSLSRSKVKAITQPACEMQFVARVALPSQESIVWNKSAYGATLLQVWKLPTNAPRKWDKRQGDIR